MLIGAKACAEQRPLFGMCARRHYGGDGAAFLGCKALQARPIYHHKRESIDAHLNIVSAALAVTRWLEDTTGWSIRKFVRTARRYATAQGRRLPALQQHLRAPQAAHRGRLLGHSRSGRRPDRERAGGG
jgi:hypothetical protein